MPSSNRKAAIVLGIPFALFVFFSSVLLIVRGPHLATSTALLLAVLLAALVTAGYWVLLRVISAKHTAERSGDGLG